MMYAILYLDGDENYAKVEKVYSSFDKTKEQLVEMYVKTQIDQLSIDENIDDIDDLDLNRDQVMTMTLSQLKQYLIPILRQKAEQQLTPRKPEGPIR